MTDVNLCSRVPARYRVLRPLGRGGQGSVYLVEDGACGGVPLALKAVAADVARLGDVDAIATEFLTLSRLAHPGLARVRDFGRLDEGSGVYFTAEFVVGRPLLEWAGSEAQDLESHVVDLARQGLAVIAYLHRRGIEHGDIKPQNILVEEREGRPVLRLVDFGSARLRDADPDETRFGTPAYMPSAEVDRDDRAPVDADLYGLGMSIFHGLVGHLPFTLDDRAARRQWLARGEPADLARWRPEVSSQLDRLVRGLTSSRRGEQFRDAAHAGESLRGTVATTATRGGTPRLSPVVGREEVFSRLVESVGASSPALTLLVGAGGSGKSALLDGVRAQLQVRGVDVIHFDEPSDVHGVASLLRLGGAGEEVTASSSASEDLAAEIEARLEQPLAVLVDHADRGAWPGLLRALLAPGFTGRCGGSRITTIVAGRDREGIERGLESRAEAAVVELGPLGRDGIAVLASDHLGVESVSPRLLDALESHSGGHPSTLRRVLEAVGRSGVSVDFLGELVIPGDFESRVARALQEPLEDAGDEIAGPVARMASFLLIGRAALNADEAAILCPQFDRAQWERGLDELRDRGLAVRRGVEAPWRAGVISSLSATDLAKRLAAADLRAPGREIAATAVGLSTTAWTSLRSPEVAACGARHLLFVGAPELACRWALRARSRYLGQARGVEAFELLAEAVRSAARPVSGMWRCLARLRAADLAVVLGRAAEGLELLGSRGARVPRRLRGAVLERRARLLEQLGRRPEAVRAFAAFLRPGPRMPSVAKRLECLARMTHLSFAEGAPVVAKRYLREARRLLPRCDDDAPEVTIRASSLLADCEMDHGDAARAEALLHRSVNLARAASREDLARQPLARLAVYLAGRGERARALVLFAELEEIARRRGERLERLKALYIRALL